MKRRRLRVLRTREKWDFLILRDLIHVVRDAQSLRREGTGKARRECSVYAFQKSFDLIPGKRFLLAGETQPGFLTETLLERGERVPGSEEVFRAGKRQGFLHAFLKLLYFLGHRERVPGTQELG